MKKYIIVIVFGTLALTGYSQSKFRVLASSGASTITGKNSALSVGQVLSNSYQIKVAPRSYLSLVHSSGGTVQISKAGVYNVATLEKRLDEQRKSLSSRYATYIISELTKKGKENINANRYKYMNVTGSVKRATFNAFSVYLPDRSNFYDPKVTITWQALVGTKNYLLKIMDRFEEEVLYTKTLADTSTVVDFSQGKLKGALDCLVFIESKERGIQSDKYGLFRLDEEDAPKFNKAYSAFKASNKATRNATAQLSEAFFFEDKGFYTDALRCYQAAVKMSEQADAYVIALQQFLVRRNMGQTPEEDKND
ncbi:hypothetical protein [Microscilla marina]|uniref:Uncharacterized protein n=1 Tax=Microscilla marina ATCC 23134 TaxID=313606 RepID=A1ZM65_MICM2|nr:hypothetical protein [Microscilla marina]EAY28597.1 hypothetical protein M23134_04444 [Microscilla marina ATCC 23134]